MRLAPVLVMLALVSGPCLGAEELTLEECLKRVMEEHPSLISARRSVEARHEEIVQARSTFFPKVSASVGADLWRRSAPGGPVEGVIPGTDTEPTSSLSATWKILGAQTPLQYRRAVIELEETQGTLRDTERELTSNAVSAYYDLLEAQKVLALQGGLHELKRQELELEERRVAEGSTSPLRGMATELGMLEEDRALREAEAERTRAAAELSLLVGGNVEPDRPLEELTDASPAEPASLEEWLSAAGENRGDLVARRASVRAAEKSATMAFWERLPSVNLGMQYAMNPDPFYGTDAAPFRMRFLGTEAVWTFGLGLELPLFTGGDLKARHNHARIVLRQTEDTLVLAEREVERDVRVAHVRYQAALTKLGISRRELELTKERTAVIDKLYQSGVEYHRVDWQRSLTEVARGEVALVRAQVEVRESWVRLLRSAGLPLESKGP